MLSAHVKLFVTKFMSYVQDEILIEEPRFMEFWHRDVEESICQGSAKPFVEEAALHVSNWGFSLVDLQVRRNCLTQGFLLWLKSMYTEAECELAGFLRPIHIWQVCQTYS